jgi:hypothetical protein
MLSVGNPVLSTYRIEVSGWDSSEAFFVEKTDLIWTEEAGKRIRTTLFVRLLQPISPNRSMPVPYEAEIVGMAPEGTCEIRLNRVRARASLKEGPALELPADYSAPVPQAVN